VFSFDGTRWIQQARLAAGDGSPDDGFGSSVAISGSTALVGPLWKSAAYAFAFDGTSWTPAAELTGVPGRQSAGFSVALSSDTAILLEDLTEAAYVYSVGGTGFTLQATLAPTDPVFSSTSVTASGAVAMSGNAVLMGPAGMATDAAYLFTFDGTRWTERERLMPSRSGAQGGFGCSVGLSGDMAIVGSYAETDLEGAAYIFRFDGTR
jgi:hypothetical protein